MTTFVLKTKTNKTKKDQQKRTTKNTQNPPKSTSQKTKNFSEPKIVAEEIRASFLMAIELPTTRLIMTSN